MPGTSPAGPASWRPSPARSATYASRVTPRPMTLTARLGRPHWSVQELAGQLADERNRLDGLRHRDLEVRASFSLSYGGLQTEEQRLFRLLGLLEAPDVARWTAAALLDTSP